MPKLKILLPNEIAGRLTAALARVGYREVGGILMGEHVSPWCFRIVDLTIQHRGGGVAFFVRATTGVRAALRRFFKRTRNKYTQYNYLGEWHSHPKFNLRPSTTDIRSMFEIVEDPGVGAKFAVLLIVRLGEAGCLEASATGFFHGLQAVEGQLISESKSGI